MLEYEYGSIGVVIYMILRYKNPNINFGIIVFWIVRCCKKNKYQNRRSNGVWLRVYTEIGNTARKPHSSLSPNGFVKTSFSDVSAPENSAKLSAIVIWEASSHCRSAPLPVSRALVYKALSAVQHGEYNGISPSRDRRHFG